MPPRKKSASKKRSAPRSGRKRGAGSLKLILAGLFLLVFLIGSLVFLARLSESLRSEKKGAEIPATVTPTETEPRPMRRPAPADATALLEDVRVELESALLRSGVALSDLQTRIPSVGPVRFEVKGEFPPSGILTDLERRLGRIDAGLRLERQPAAGMLQVLWRGEPRFLLFFQPPASAGFPVLPPAGKPRLAIIMDDLGRDMVTGRALLELELPVTFAILPGEIHAAELADLAYRHGREVLIHLPMEPQGYPVVQPGTDALLTDMSADEIDRKMKEFRRQVPHAIGGNNHMGSRFTESREGMQAVLEVMRREGLFFVDSLTTGHSVAYAEARRAGVPAAVRDVFLDNEPEVEKIAAEIRRLGRLAAKQGHAVGICHPYPQTLEALRRELPGLQTAGLDVVPISRLLVR